MKKYNLSKIMKRAWEIKKEDARNIFSICLKIAWEEAKSMKSYENLPELTGKMVDIRLATKWRTKELKNLQQQLDFYQKYIDRNKKVEKSTEKKAQVEKIADEIFAHTEATWWLENTNIVRSSWGKYVTK